MKSLAPSAAFGLKNGLSANDTQEKDDTMAQSVPAAIPLQVPTPPRALEGLSGKMDRLTPTVLNQFEELSGQIGKLAPPTFDEYVRDFWQRSVLFLDILRQRGNQREEMLAHGVTSVLIYDSELVMRGDELPRPANYSLLRIIPRRAPRS